MPVFKRKTGAPFPCIGTFERYQHEYPEKFLNPGNSAPVGGVSLLRVVQPSHQFSPAIQRARAGLSTGFRRLGLRGQEARRPGIPRARSVTLNAIITRTRIYGGSS